MFITNLNCDLDPLPNDLIRSPGWLHISLRSFSPGFFDNEATAGPPAAALWRTDVPKAKNCLIVRAAGRQLDLLRGEASRIAKGNNVDWWIDQAEVGTRFCFENTKAKRVIRSRL